jgi:metal-responsive CopG/Arc/MetJ family transcriptional regulator
LAEASPQGEASVLFADLPREEVMAERMVRLRLNQQQLELIDNSVKAGEASSRAELIRRALREYAASHTAADKD